MREKDIDNWFSYHTPTPEKLEAYEVLRRMVRQVVDVFDNCVPDCADKTAAVRKLRESVMAMNLAISCYAPPETLSVL